MAWKLDLYYHLCCHHNFNSIFLWPDSFPLWYNQSTFDRLLVILKMDLQSCFVTKMCCLLFIIWEKHSFPPIIWGGGGESYFFPMCSQFLLFRLKSVQNPCSLLTERWVVHLMLLMKGMPSRGILTGLRGEPVWVSWKWTRASAMSCTWVEAIASIHRHWVMNALTAALWRRALGYW